MHQIDIGKTDQDQVIVETTLAVVLTTVEITESLDKIRPFIGTRSQVFLRPQTGLLYLFSIITCIVGNLNCSITDRAGAPVITCIVRIIVPVIPESSVHRPVEIGRASCRERVEMSAGAGVVRT